MSLQGKPADQRFSIIAIAVHCSEREAQQEEESKTKRQKKRNTSQLKRKLSWTDKGRDNRESPKKTPVALRRVTQRGAGGPHICCST